MPPHPRTRIASALLALLVIAVVLPTGLSMMLKSIDGDALTQSAEGRAALNRLTYAAAKGFPGRRWTREL